MDPASEDELSAVIEGDSLKITAGAEGYAEIRVLAEEGENRMGFDLKLDVVTGTGPLQAALQPELQVYPNPSKEMTTVAFELLKPGRVRLTVLDATGKEIVILADEYRLPGNHQYNWNTRGIQTGIYLCSLTVSVRTSATSSTLAIESIQSEAHPSV